MNQLLNGINKQQNKTTTLNRAKAFVSTKSACLDLFAGWGGMRGKDIIPLFEKAHKENKDIAHRIILWGRDIRGGAGERQLFRNALTYLAIKDYKLAIKLIHKIPELGRWDDLFVLHNTPAWYEAANLIEKALKDGHGLCAKWMPRKGPIAYALRKHMGLSPKNYRKLLVTSTNVVENKMCANQWNKINYNHVPSQAARIYSRAFTRHDPYGYNAYKETLLTGTAKINASATFPHEILCGLNIDEQIAEAQWKAQPNWVQEGMNFLPLIDTSGSMGSWRTKGSPANIAIALGLYLAERNTSVFKDHFITFSSEPTLQHVTGTLKAKADSMSVANWEMNTNINAVFNLILNTAKKNKVPEKDMPKICLIISDMQFDGTWDQTNYSQIKSMYKQHGYELPKIIFWNVNYYGNNPVKKDKENTTLISGYSPSIMKSILSQKDVTPYDQMLETIMNPRYNYL